MGGFLYSVLLKFLYPTSVALVLLVVAALAGRRRALRRTAFGLALVVLFVCGNGWVVHSLVRSLEWRYLPPDPVPAADAIVVLSGGLHALRPPRPTVEVSEAGDRVLYAAELFRQGRAPQVIATGGVGTGSLAQRAESEEMADLLVMIGVPRSALVVETQSQNTHEHGVYLCPMFAERGVRRVLLVTSAIHMRRSMGAFRRSCPDVEYIAAPTDFRITEGLPAPWYRHVVNLLPTPHAYADFSAATHEYIGMGYYWLRGWL